MADPSGAAVAAKGSGLGRLAPDFDLLLCDVFGTIHDAHGVFPPAIDALSRFREGGGTVVLVSNSAIPGPLLARTLAAQGIGPDVHDAIVSSADVTRALIAQRAARRILHLGLGRERTLFEGLEVDLCEAEVADLAVCTGYPDGDFGPALEIAHARDLDLVCSNPDRQVVAGGTLLRFAGLVAATYAERGGSVIITGKPGAAIYERAFERAHAATGRTFAADRTIGVGDSLDLDVAGAWDRGFAAIHISHMGATLGGDRRYSLSALFW